MYLSCLCQFVFFKQNTAYEMRISDWSSDVCSSDLSFPRTAPAFAAGVVASGTDIMRRPFLSAFALAAGFAMTGPAFAHARLERAVPDGKATLAPTLDSLKLFFSAGLVIALRGATVTDAGQHPVQTGPPVQNGRGSGRDRVGADV